MEQLSTLLAGEQLLDESHAVAETARRHAKFLTIAGRESDVTFGVEGYPLKSCRGYFYDATTCVDHNHSMSTEFGHSNLASGWRRMFNQRRLIDKLALLVIVVAAASLVSCTRPAGQVAVARSGLSYGGTSLEEWIEQLGGSFVPNEIIGSGSPQPALQAIGAIGVPAVPVLAASLADGRWWIRQAGAAGLGKLGVAAAGASSQLVAAS